MMRRLAFLRGKSVSEKDSPSMGQAETSKRPSTVPDIASDLTRFAGNLPESHKNLFLKLLQPAPTELERFNELPEKIRLKIWREALPKGRDIRLRVQYQLIDYNKAEFGFPPPTTLHVNKESRKETQKYFYFFLQSLAFGNVPSLPLKPVLYCINPFTDKISISFQSLFDSHFVLFIKTMFLYIPDCMDAFRVLEIVDVYQSGFAHQDGNLEVIKQFLTDTVVRFHHLDELQFILNDREELDQEIVRAWKVKVIKAFAKEKRSNPECNIPKVICVSWKVRDAMKYLKMEHNP